MINQTRCPISDSEIYPFISLGPQPISMGISTDAAYNDQYNEMTWGATEEGIVHLMTRIPLDVLYGNSHNSGLVGKVWKLHHHEFAKFISKFQPNKICEIGGGHGALSEIYEKRNDFTQWEIFEPNPTKSSKNKICVRDEFFSEHSIIDKKDCFIHSHLFEHLYDHGSILTAIHRSLTDDGMMIFSLPNLRSMVKRGYVNALNFEHVTYLPEDLVEYLLLKYGFHVLEKQYFLDDHSIFYCCGKKTPDNTLFYNNKKNIHIVTDYYERIKKEIEILNSKVFSQNSSASIYLFGAHIFSQFFLTNGLNSSRIKNILDNDTFKQDRRLYGTVLNVVDPRIISADREPVVVLKVGAYRKEIIDQLRKINRNVKIIE